MGEKAGAKIDLKAGLTSIVCVAFAHATRDVTVEWIVPGGKNEWKPIPPSLLVH